MPLFESKDVVFCASILCHINFWIWTKEMEKKRKN